MITRIRAILFKNWIPKLTCLLIAIGLWFWVAIQQTGRAQFEVPIEFVNTPDQLFITDNSTRNVTMTLQGPKTTLYRTSASELVAQLNLRGQSEGTKAFWSSELTYTKPQNLDVYEVSPRKVRVTLDRRTEKVIGVEPSVDGSLPEGFDYRISVAPDTAKIFGSNQVTETVRQLELPPVSLQDRQTGVTTLTRQVKLPEGLRLKAPPENEFQVRLEVYEEKITDSLKNVPVSVTGVAAGMKAIVEPSTVDLTVRGPKRTVENLSPEDVEVVVNAPEKGSGLVIRVPEVNLPDGVELVNGDQTVSALKVKLKSQ